MKTKRSPKSKRAKLTDAERHARFVDTARKVGASENPKDFDRAFTNLTRSKSPKPSGRP
jgi:hypothetical protein